MISFSTPPSTLTKEMEAKAYRYTETGKIHLASANQFGVRYICKDKPAVLELLMALGSESTFCTIVTKSSDRNGDPVLFAHAK